MIESVQNNHTDTYLNSFDSQRWIRGARILDVGCGAGYAAKRFLDLGAREVHALEPSLLPGQRPRWIQDQPVFFYHTWDSLPGDSFDLIWHHHVIEHVENYFAFLRQIRSMLCPQGWMWMACPNMAHTAVFCPGHIHNFQAAQLVEVLKLTGFATAECRIWALKGQLRLRVPAQGHCGYPAPMQQALDTQGRCDSNLLDNHQWKE